MTSKAWSIRMGDVIELDDHRDPLESAILAQQRLAEGCRARQKLLESWVPLRVLVEQELQAAKDRVT